MGADKKQDIYFYRPYLFTHMIMSIQCKDTHPTSRHSGGKLEEHTYQIIKQNIQLSHNNMQMVRNYIFTIYDGKKVPIRMFRI